jgi:hypothetical protein
MYRLWTILLLLVFATLAGSEACDPGDGLIRALRQSKNGRAMCAKYMTNDSPATETTFSAVDSPPRTLTTLVDHRVTLTVPKTLFHTDSVVSTLIQMTTSTIIAPTSTPPPPQRPVVTVTVTVTLTETTSSIPPPSTFPTLVSRSIWVPELPTLRTPIPEVTSAIQAQSSHSTVPVPQPSHEPTSSVPQISVIPVSWPPSLQPFTAVSIHATEPSPTHSNIIAQSSNLPESLYTGAPETPVTSQPSITYQSTNTRSACTPAVYTTIRTITEIPTAAACGNYAFPSLLAVAARDTNDTWGFDEALQSSADTENDVEDSGDEAMSWEELLFLVKRSTWPEGNWSSACSCVNWPGPWSTTTIFRTNTIPPRLVS